MIAFGPGSAALAATLALAVSGPVQAADFLFGTDPFAGTTALETPGRQVVGGATALVIPSFDIDGDRLLFDVDAFASALPFEFANALASGLPDTTNLISLRDIDADGDITNGVLNNAVLSANLIAANTVGAGPGLFIYYNSSLDVNRLVFSTDLSSGMADLAILAVFADQKGTVAAAALQQYGAENFGTTGAIPEPATWAMLIAGFGLVGSAARRRRRSGGSAPAVAG